MAGNQISLLAVADFTIEPLTGMLANDSALPGIEAHAAPFGSVASTLMRPDLACWRRPYDALVVWSRPEAISPAFARLLQHEVVPLEELLADVDDFCALLTHTAADRARFVLVPSWVLPPYRRAYAILDPRAGGISNALARMNLRLAESLEPTPTLAVLDTQRWLSAVGSKAVNPRLWYMAKVAFSPEVFREAVADIKAALTALTGRAKKLLVVDLDNTMWGGVVGEVGWHDLKLGGHDATGEAFQDFQRALKALTRRGVLLAIASKNDEQVALEAIAKHPEMILRQNDFSAWRINWRDKAENVADLVAELNLGLDSVVFIDDHPVERARVREALPDVWVPEWPHDPMLYTSELMGLRCFDVARVTSEDLGRAEMYVQDRQRRQVRDAAGSFEQWLASLETRVTVEPFNDANAERAVQLINKTNQMNLSTRRLSEQELRAWLSSPPHHLWTFRVVDRFGDSGLTGIASVKLDGEVASFVDFILSCRVMGRRIEETMLHVAVAYARQHGAREVRAKYLETKKNKPCLEFWQRSGFDAQEKDTFVWSLEREYPRPQFIDLVHVDAPTQ